MFYFLNLLFNTKGASPPFNPHIGKRGMRWVFHHIRKVGGFKGGFAPLRYKKIDILKII
jgi:hypothetical protein